MYLRLRRNRYSKGRGKARNFWIFPASAERFSVALEIRAGRKDTLPAFAVAVLETHSKVSDQFFSRASCSSSMSGQAAADSLDWRRGPLQKPQRVVRGTPALTWLGLLRHRLQRCVVLPFMDF